MDTKFCDQCGASIRSTAKFCPNCGADVSSIIISQKKKTQLSKEVKKEDSTDIGLPKNNRRFSKKILVLVLSIVGVALITVIVLVSVFLSRSCSSSNITSYSNNIIDSETASFDATSPDLAELVSPDQLAILSVDGLPQAYTIYIDPASGSVIEQWSYYLLGKEINFLDGAYDGGIEVPLPETAPDIQVPQLPLYSWEILKDFSPGSVVSQTGTALFNTSALVLPGWNDGYEVARLWLLSGGGNMVTVDGRLVMLNIDPGEALDLDQFTINNFLVGTLVDDNNRLGAILSPDNETGSFRLSLSPRGQGATEDGTCFIFELTGSNIENTFVMGEDAEAIIAEIDGTESNTEASGTVTIEKNSNGYDLLINARINDQHYMLTGFMGSAVWRSNDSSTLKAIGDAPELIGEASELNVDDPELTGEDPEQIVITEDETQGESEDGVLTFSETFDSNENGWPVSEGEENELAYYQSDILLGQYLVFGQQKKQGDSFIERLIPLKLEQAFSINIDVKQLDAENSGGGLVLSDKNGVNEIYFIVFAEEGYFWIVQRDSNGLRYPLDSPFSEINPTEEINTLTINRDGPDFYFSINDMQVASLTIEDFSVDYLGVVVNIGSEGPVICYFDNLEIYDLR